MSSLILHPPVHGGKWVLIGGACYDYSFRQPKLQKDIVDLLVELGAAPFTGEYRDRSGQ